MSEVILGIGEVPHRSYWLTLSTLSGAQVWEGLIEAIEVTNPNGTLGLNANSRTIPIEVQNRVRSLNGYTAKWESAWEEIPRKLLTDGSRKLEG